VPLAEKMSGIGKGFLDGSDKMGIFVGDEDRRGRNFK
jgi:hypothetical protein